MIPAWGKPVKKKSFDTNLENSKNNIQLFLSLQVFHRD